LFIDLSYVYQVASLGYLKNGGFIVIVGLTLNSNLYWRFSLF
jgi:hypothetical protein